MNREVIVSDIGRYTSRFGQAGEDLPSSVFHSVLISSGENSNQIIPQSNNNELNYQDKDFSNVFDENEGKFSQKVFEHLWSAYNPRECDLSVLIIEPAWLGDNNKDYRQMNMELHLELRGASTLAMVKDAPLACFAVGKTTGVVVDITHKGSRATAVTEGWAETKGYLESSLGGMSIEQYLRDNVPGLVISSSLSSRNVDVLDARLLKHRLLPQNDDVNETISSQTNYQLPDGSVISLISALSSRVVDELMEPQFPCHSMNPSPIGEERIDEPGKVEQPTISSGGRGVISNVKGSIRVGIPRQVSHVVDHFDKDTQCAMFRGVVVCGGGARLPNVVPKLKVGSHLGEAVQVNSVPEPYLGDEAWLGGSIVASLPVFRDLSITKAQYDEIGPGIFDRRL